MAAQHVGRLIGWGMGCILAPIVLGSLFGPRWVAVGIVLATLLTLALVMWLPRSAHAAFAAGRFPRAARRYRILASLAFTGPRERAAILSRAACDLGAGHVEAADSILGTLDAATLSASERVVWLNNRACAALDAGRDPQAALALVDEAIGMRPDVPAIQHTRARALLAVGRVDDAIAVLDAMRTGGELPTALEAERCRDLATAWDRKGQRAYADDYRNRARLQVR
ncbi:MAG: tetratricopeptide repeat protein [Kofleriaceae bacterium]|nr:tetratricopeptide repeat protein [Kofleriaceae bacterium]